MSSKHDLTTITPSDCLDNELSATNATRIVPASPNDVLLLEAFMRLLYRRKNIIEVTEILDRL